MVKLKWIGINIFRNYPALLKYYVLYNMVQPLNGFKSKYIYIFSLSIASEDFWSSFKSNCVLLLIETAFLILHLFLTTPRFCHSQIICEDLWLVSACFPSKLSLWEELNSFIWKNGLNHLGNKSCIINIKNQEHFSKDSSRLIPR